MWKMRTPYRVVPLTSTLRKDYVHTQPHTMHTQMYPHRMYIQMLSNYTLAHISVDMHSHAVYMQHITCFDCKKWKRRPDLEASCLAFIVPEAM